MKNISALLALLGWFAVIAQLMLMMENRTVSMTESAIRFVSYFTILTNTLVAIYFTVLLFSKNASNFIRLKPGRLTAITVYITVVGLVYQVALRQLWNPQGLQMIVDELLHTIIPILVILFWILFEITASVKYSKIPAWCIYPLLYSVFILIRGNLSGFYPYPFINVYVLGMTSALLNAALLLILFAIIAAVYIFIGKKLINRS